MANEQTRPEDFLAMCWASVCRFQHQAARAGCRRKRLRTLGTADICRLFIAACLFVGAVLGSFGHNKNTQQARKDAPVNLAPVRLFWLVCVVFSSAAALPGGHASASKLRECSLFGDIIHSVAGGHKSDAHDVCKGSPNKVHIVRSF